MKRQLTIDKVYGLMEVCYRQRCHAHSRLCGLVRELARRKGFACWREFQVVYENEFCPVVIFHGYGRLAFVTISAFFTMTREEIVDLLLPYLNPQVGELLKKTTEKE